MPKPTLEFVALRRETETIGPDRRWQRLANPRTILTVATPSGAIREVELSRKELASLLQQAASLTALALIGDDE